MLVKDLVHCVHSGQTLLVNLFISKKFFTITVFIFHFHLFLAPQSGKNFKDIKRVHKWEIKELKY